MKNDIKHMAGLVFLFVLIATMAFAGNKYRNPDADSIFWMNDQDVAKSIMKECLSMPRCPVIDEVTMSQTDKVWFWVSKDGKVGIVFRGAYALGNQIYNAREPR